MFRKALKKLKSVTLGKDKPTSKRAAPPKESPKPAQKAAPLRLKEPLISSGKLLTAEGWKRLMMKKHRKSS